MFATRAGGARETDETRRKEDGVADNSVEETREVRAGEARKIRETEERAGGARETEESAGGARETEETREVGAWETGEIFCRSAEAKAEAEENAAVLEILEKNGAKFFI